MIKYTQIITMRPYCDICGLPLGSAVQVQHIHLIGPVLAQFTAQMRAVGYRVLEEPHRLAKYFCGEVCYEDYKRNPVARDHVDEHSFLFDKDPNPKP